MNSRAGDSAFTSNLKERHTGILYQEGKYFLVYLINVILGHNLHFLTNWKQIYKLFCFFTSPDELFCWRGTGYNCLTVSQRKGSGIFSAWNLII